MSGSLDGVYKGTLFFAAVGAAATVGVVGYVAFSIIDRRRSKVYLEQALKNGDISQKFFKENYPTSRFTVRGHWKKFPVSAEAVKANAVSANALNSQAAKE